MSCKQGTHICQENAQWGSEARVISALTAVHEVPGSNPAGGGIQFMTARLFTAQRLSLSPFHYLSMT